MFTRNSALFSVAVAALMVVGCAGRPALIPVSDKDLDRTAAQFAADAAKRTYPDGAQSAEEAQVRAEIDYGVFKRMKLVNLSDQDWKNVEIWVNEKYVVFIPNWKAKDLKKVNFQMLYDREGQSFTIDNSKTRIQKVEIVRDGTRAPAVTVLAD